jgi:hypothetical protein
MQYMFMLSFICVIVCYLFVWKRICAGFLLEIKYQEVSIDIALTGLTQSDCYTSHKPGPGFLSNVSIIFLYSMI